MEKRLVMGGEALEEKEKELDEGDEPAKKVPVEAIAKVGK